MRKPTYDKYGRMQYCAELHGRHGLPWTNKEEQYLIDNYLLDGPEEISLVLERTIHTVMTRANELRRKGRMPDRPAGARHHGRMNGLLRKEGRP